MDLVELVKQCQLGDIEAFNELYKLYNKKALRTVYLISGRRDFSDDIVQEAFIQCFLSLKTLHKPEKFNCWFYSILLRNTWKVKSKYKNSLSIEEAFESDRVGNSEETVEEAYESKEVHSIVQKSIDKLGKSMKATVILFYYEDMSISDISSILNCFEGTVKSRLHNARKLIKKDLGEYNKGLLPDRIFQEKGCSNG